MSTDVLVDIDTEKTKSPIDEDNNSSVKGLIINSNSVTKSTAIVHNDASATAIVEWPGKGTLINIKIPQVNHPRPT